MKATGCRRILLAAASVLALAAGTALAQQGNGSGQGGDSDGGGISLSVGGLSVSIAANGNGNGNGGGNGNGNGGGNGNGNGGGNGGGNGNGGGGDDGGGGDGSGGGGGSDDGSGGGGGSSGGGDDGSSGGVGSPPSAAPSAASAATSGSGVTETVAATERDATLGVEDLVAPSRPQPHRWTLATFSGKRVEDESGTGIGTVEGVVVDGQNNLYLVTALDSEDVDGRERVIPLGRFDLDASGDTLVLGSETVAMLPYMADLGTVASAFMMVDSDEKLRSLLAAR